MTAQRILTKEQFAPEGVPSGGYNTSEHSGKEVFAVQLLRVPDVAPPFDHEVLPAARVSVTGLPAGLDAPGPAPVDLVPARVARPSRPTWPSWPPPGEEDGAGEWAPRFARLLVEALAGSRPVRQILPWTTARARTHLRRILPALDWGQRPRVVRVLTSRPASHVVEMSVVVALGTRTRALAVRLEQTQRAGQPTRWLCTDIEAR
jgi:hypothetical protein